jgi:hypothetical protein
MKCNETDAGLVLHFLKSETAIWEG